MSSVAEVVRLKYRVDLRETIRRGRGCPIPPAIEADVDLTAMTPADREVLASRIGPAGEVVARDVEGQYSGVGRRSSDITPWLGEHGYVLVVAPTPAVEDLLGAIHREEQAIEQRRRDEAAQAELRAQRWTAWLGVLEASPLPESEVRWTWPTTADGLGWCEMTGSPPDALTERWTRYCARVTEAIQAAAESARRDADRVRAAWIADHGSQCLQRMMAEGIDCQESYDREYAAWRNARWAASLAAALPGWREAPHGWTPERYGVHDVGSRELAILDAGRAVCPSCRLARLDSETYVCCANHEGRWAYWPAE